MSQKKYKSYNALKKQLQRRGIETYGATASFLLDWGTNRKDCAINSQSAVAARVCVEGGFSVWREQLEKLGFITCSVERFKNGKERWSYYPGPLLRGFINAEKLDDDIVATMSDIRAMESKVDQEFQKLREELEEIRRAMDKAADKYLEAYPPNTPERKFEVKETFKRTGVFCIVDDLVQKARPMN